MKSLICLFLLLVALSLGETDIEFSNGDFSCVRPKTFISSCASESELEKPLFFTCHHGETRDRLIPTEVVKAYLSQDQTTSLSCKTVAWLNSRTGNARCISKTHQKLKAKFFHWLINEDSETIDCSTPKFLTKLKDTADCFLAGAIKDKCTHKSDTQLLPGYGCCDMDEYDIRSNTIFYRARGSEEVVDDLEELDRFIQFKLNKVGLKCPASAHTSTTEPKGDSKKKPHERKRHILGQEKQLKKPSKN